MKGATATRTTKEIATVEMTVDLVTATVTATVIGIVVAIVQDQDPWSLGMTYISVFGDLLISVSENDYSRSRSRSRDRKGRRRHDKDPRESKDTRLSRRDAR